MMRALSMILAVVAVLLIGRTIYELIQFGYLEWLSLALGAAAAGGAVALHRRATRAK